MKKILASLLGLSLLLGGLTLSYSQAPTGGASSAPAVAPAVKAPLKGTKKKAKKLKKHTKKPTTTAPGKK